MTFDDLGRRLAYLSAVLILLIGVGSAGEAFAQSSPREAVELSARLEGDIGRIVFDWPAPARASIRRLNTVLVLEVSRPIDADLALIPQVLERYVVLARLDPDGRVLRFAVKGDIEPRLTVLGRRMVVDLVPVGSEAELPAVEPIPGDDLTALPPEPRAAFALPILKPAELARPSEDEAEPEIAQSQSPARQAEPVQSEPQSALPPTPPEPQDTPPTTDANGIDIVTLEVTQAPTLSRIAFAWPQLVGYRATEVGRFVSVEFERPGTLSLEALRKTPLREVIDAKILEGEDGQLTVTIERAGQSRMRHYRDGNRIVIDVIKAADRAVGESGLKIASQHKADMEDTSEAENGVKGVQENLLPLVPGGTKPQRPKRAMEPAARIDAKWSRPDWPLIPITLSANSPGAGLVFEWPRRPGAAVFRRGDHIWIVFDQPGRFDFKKLEGEYRDLMVATEQLPHDRVAIMRVTVHSRTLASIRQINGNWQVDLAETIAKPASPLTVTRVFEGPRGAEVLVELKGGADTISFRDPEVGDQVSVVTMTAGGKGIITQQSFVDFSALASAQGLAVIPHADGVVLTVSEENVRIGKANGLSLAGPDTRVGKLDAKERDAGPGHIDFLQWARGGNQSFTNNVRGLQDAVRQAQDLATRNAARLALAQFFMANGFNIEALGVLKLMTAEDPESAADPAFRAVRGVTALLSERPREALDDLGHHSLRYDPSAALWRAVARVALKDWTGARRDLETGAPALSLYEPEVQVRFLVAEAEAALGVKDLGAAREAVRRAETMVSDVPIGTEVGVLKGRIAEALDNPEEALKQYEAVVAKNFLPTQIIAAFRHLMLSRRLGLISPDDAIDRLETLRFRWRGDETELSVLRELGDLYAQKGEVRQALNVMRLAVQSYPGESLAREVANDMTELFASLYIDGGADKMSPVQALALFYDFPELVPVGMRGDTMIRRLSDRLVSVDLLAQAAELLDHQVRFRLQGVARAQVATRLAMIHLMDRQPGKALQTIHGTRQTRLPERLNRQRRILEARALGEMGRIDHALEVIEDYKSPDALRLRSDILWKGERWAEAASFLERLAELAEQSSDEFTPEIRRDILRAAIGYTLGDDEESLGRLRASFASQMAKSPDAKAFNVVSQPIERQGIEFRDLAGKIAGTDTLDEFMKSYREQYDPPSEVGG